jgi:hypothetical protein
MSVLKDQIVNWIASQEEPKKVEDRKVMSQKERLKMITAIITAQQTINDKCRSIYESKPTSELYSIIVINDVNITALKKIKEQNEG